MSEEEPRRGETSLIIQADWNDCIRAGGDHSTFFVGYRRHAEDEGRTKFRDVAVGQGGTIATVPLDDECKLNFSIDAHGRLHATDSSTLLDTQFIAPYSVLSTPTSTAALSLDISPSGNLLAVGDSEGSLQVLSTHNMSVQRSLEGHTLDVSVCRFFPSSLVLLSGGVDLKLRVWSVETATCVRELTGHNQAITDVGIIEEGKTVLSCSRDGCLIRWNCGSSEMVFKKNIELGPCTSLSISNDFTKILVTCELGFSLLDIDGNEIFSERSKEPLSCGCFSFGGLTINVGSERFLQQIDIQSRKVIATLLVNRGLPRRMIGREEGLFTAFMDGSITCHDLNSLSDRTSPLFEMTGADSDPVYDLSAHGKSLYTTCRDKSVRIYRIP